MKKTLVALAIVMLGVLPKAAKAQIIQIDGSSTVFPITEAVSEEFQKAKKGVVKVTVGIAGTGGGFKKFCRGETDISDASRPILKQEMETCKQSGVQYPAAQGKVTTWNQVRSEWPNSPLKLFGPGADSGTFDYFTEAIVGKAKSSRGDFTASEDDNVLVQGIANDRNALGYFGFAYYIENQKKLKAAPIDAGKGPVLPSAKTVEDGSYQPLSRPIFIYISKKSLDSRPEVREYVEFYLKNAPSLVKQVKYVALPQNAYTVSLEHVKKGKVGTVFGGEPEVGIKIDDLLKREAKY